MRFPFANGDRRSPNAISVRQWQSPFANGNRRSPWRSPFAKRESRSPMAFPSASRDPRSPMGDSRLATRDRRSPRAIAVRDRRCRVPRAVRRPCGLLSKMAREAHGRSTAPGTPPSARCGGRSTPTLRSCRMLTCARSRSIFLRRPPPMHATPAAVNDLRPTRRPRPNAPTFDNPPIRADYHANGRAPVGNITAPRKGETAPVTPCSARVCPRTVPTRAGMLRCAVGQDISSYVAGITGKIVHVGGGSSGSSCWLP
jgi:hypothetical protein